MPDRGVLYRPPSEAGSLLIQATVGCPHNKCRFCGMYQDTRFRIRLVKDIIEDLDAALDRCGPGVRTLFFPDGNTIVMKTPSLVKILEHAGRNFPHLERITLYGSAKYLFLKSVEELKELHEAGLTRVHMGLESGDDETLRYANKGADAATCVTAGQKVKEAGIELSVYYLIGLGGRARWREHAIESARVINAMKPDFIRLRTFSPTEGTPIYQDALDGRFETPSPHEALDELKLLVSALDGPFMLLSDHIASYFNLTGELPGDKPELLAEIEEVGAWEESKLARRHIAL